MVGVRGNGVLWGGQQLGRVLRATLRADHRSPWCTLGFRTAASVSAGRHGCCAFPYSAVSGSFEGHRSAHSARGVGACGPSLSVTQSYLSETTFAVVVSWLWVAVPALPATFGPARLRGPVACPPPTRLRVRCTPSNSIQSAQKHCMTRGGSARGRTCATCPKPF